MLVNLVFTPFNTIKIKKTPNTRSRERPKSRFSPTGWAEKKFKKNGFTATFFANGGKSLEGMVSDKAGFKGIFFATANLGKDPISSFFLNNWKLG